jgi:hypothetical protein
LEGIKVYFEKDPYANVPAQKPTGVELDTGDDVDQDSFDAPFNPPQVAEMCAPLPARKPRIKIRIKRSGTS